MQHRIVQTPIGPLTLVGEGERLRGVYYPGHCPSPDRSRFGGWAPGAFAIAVAQLDEYFAGGRTGFELDVEAAGTPFQRAVWRLIAAIPYGETRTYAQLARALRQPTHPRAVGGAVGRNPLSVIVACHRVVGSTGALTGYAGGVERKRFLLELEGGLPSRIRQRAIAAIVSSPNGSS